MDKNSSHHDTITRPSPDFPAFDSLNTADDSATRTSSPPNTGLTFRRGSLTTNALQRPFVYILILLAVLLPLASASVIPSLATTAPDTHSVHFSHQDTDQFNDLITLDEEIIFDHSPPPAPDHPLFKRQDSDPIATDPSSTSSTTLPQPFDHSLGNNFTAPTCLPFFQTFLANATFNACLPFSLLLQTSASFFATPRNPSLLTRTLDATCNVNVTDCSILMSDLNDQLRSASVCGPDLDRQNPIVSQAASGFAAYDTLYRAACLKSDSPAPAVAGSPSPGGYCYAAAATNATSPASAYVYFLPLGMELPDDARPACTDCLRDTMGIFAAAATQRGNPVAANYAAAARTVAAACGDRYARLDVKIAVSGAGSWRGGSARRMGMGGMIAVLGAIMVQLV